VLRLGARSGRKGQAGHRYGLRHTAMRSMAAEPGSVGWWD
jgi:hypothetical protein